MVMMPFAYSITNGTYIATGTSRPRPAVRTYVVSAVFGFCHLMPALGLT